MPKYEVVAYKRTRYTIEVEANNTKEAKKKAKQFNVTAWDHDCEFYDFAVVDAQKVEDDE